ncbi:MAG TPA: DUF4433 domain-containing protein [bacterium]|nr:DUF4433 domain-containing protein [bacterium]HQL61144.1 DUF4433 domain-containing protein [bacterium]
MTEIYHITHIGNLQSICSTGGIFNDLRIKTHGVNLNSIAHEHIRQSRAIRPVPIAPYGTLGDYVPFYFAPRSPMLYAVYCGKVKGFCGTQKDILYLVSSVEQVITHNLPFLFTDGHAAMDITQFFNSPGDFSRIDWNMMKERYWHDTDQDPDRTRRRQAEFLVRDFMPWDLFGIIGVFDDTIGKQVFEITRSAEHQPEIAVHRDWYY